MRIGIDIDDVITDTSSKLIEFINTYDKNNQMKDYLVEILRGEVPTLEIQEVIYNNSLEIFGKVDVKPNVSKVINGFIDNGHEVFIITSRGNLRYSNSEKFTIEFLKKHNINYTKILFNCFDKAEICKQNDIDVMIDDSVKYCEEIQEKNIKSFVFTSIVNKDINTNVPRVNNWLELNESIKNIIKENI